MKLYLFFYEFYGKKSKKSSTHQQVKCGIKTFNFAGTMDRLRMVFGFLIFLSGCMLAPKKDLPEISLASSYVEGKDLVSSAQDLEIDWWKKFNDPILNECISIALSRNFDLRLAREKVYELRANYKIETANLFPNINGFASPGRLKKPQTILEAPTVGNPIQNLYTVGFDAIWELDFFGKTINAMDAAYYEILGSEEDVHSTQVTVVAEVAKLYTNLRTLQQRIYVLERKIEAQEKILALAEILYASGLGDDLLFENENANLALDRSLLPQLQSDYKQSLYQLTFLLGKNPGEISPSFEKRQPIPRAEEKIPVGLPSDLLRKRPDIRSAEKNYYSACAKVGQARADLFPTISLTALWGGASNVLQNVLNSGSQFWLIWPTINWNLFQGWKTLANIKVKNSQQKQALISYEQTLAQALSEVESSIAAYTEEGLTLHSLKMQLLAKKRVCNLNDVLLTSGLKQVKELLVAQIDFYNVQDTYYQSKERFMANLISVYKALGGGWDDLEENS